MRATSFKNPAQNQVGLPKEDTTEPFLIWPVANDAAAITNLSPEIWTI